MTIQEAIEHLKEILESPTHAWSCEICKEEHKELLAWLQELQGIRAQQEAAQGCDKCSGITYRQTTSGKIIPSEQKCVVKITPPCYQPDGDGCAYQIYGDNNDEPIERCKECPLCYSDKVRHRAPGKNLVAENVPLTLDELREMDGVPVWVECLFNKDLSSYAIIERGKNGIFTRLFFACFDYYGDEWLAYHHRPKEASI